MPKIERQSLQHGLTMYRVYGCRCDICFDAHHNKNQNNKAKGRAYLRRLKDAPCTDCGNTFPPECMDFDHISPTEIKKTSNVARLVYCSPERIDEEVAKCELVCANCHRIRTNKRAKYGGKSRQIFGT